MSVHVHPSATVETDAVIGEETRVWHEAQIRTRARVGQRCIIGKGAFIDMDVTIGDDCKLQNYACVYHGVSLGRGVFVGPHAVFTNDVYPRATNPEFGLLRDGDWDVGTTVVGDGASIGANATILPNVRIGKWATIGAGAIVTSDVGDYELVVGSPARRIGYVCRCGRRVVSAQCPRCGELPADHPLSGSSDLQVPEGVL